MVVAIKGISITKFGERWDKSLEDLILEVSQGALKDANTDITKVDAIYVGNMLYNRMSGQGHLGAVVSTLLKTQAPAFSIEAACASGGIATHIAIQSIISGQYENVLVLGAEKMTDASGAEITSSLMGAGADRERKAGLTFPGLYAMMARAHILEFGTTRKQLAEVAVKNHYHGSLNNDAHFQNEIDIEKVLNSTMIADPLTLLDCSPISDGAAAILLSSNYTKGDVKIMGSGVRTDSLDLSGRADLTEISATKLATKEALKESGIEISEINVAEVHDCFTIAEIIAMEDLGFCKKGEGGKFIESGATRIGGKVTVNISGGLKACGHPIGATGIKQIVEITKQLRQTAGARQVKNAQIGLTHNVGGTGATAVVHVLGR